MLRIGKYQYPNQVTFAEALRIAKIAVTQYDKKMSNRDVAEALGYKIKNPNAISGYIFRKFDDICAYNIMKRHRGFMRATDVAIEALDPYDSRKAEEGKAKAIRQMAIVNKAFTEWNGEIPPETAFPSKLTRLFGLSWQEAQKHAESVRKLYIEVFPYLESTPTSSEHTSVSNEGVGRDAVTKEKSFGVSAVLKNEVRGELRTEDYGILKIKDEISIDIAIKLLQSLKTKLTSSKKKEENEKPD